MVESKWILILNSGFAPSTHFASMLGCCEQTTSKYLVSDCGEQVALCRHLLRRYCLGWKKGPPPTKTPPSPRKQAHRAWAHSPALCHLQQPSLPQIPSASGIPRESGIKRVLPPPTKNFKLWGCPAVDTLSSEQSTKETQNLQW